MVKDNQIYKRIEELEKTVHLLKNALEEKEKRTGITFVLFSGEFDRIMSVLYFSVAARTMDIPTTILFDFWSIPVLRKNVPQSKNKLFLQRMFGWMLPKGHKKTRLSRMNFCGLGKVMMNIMLNQLKQPSFEQVFQMAIDSDVQFRVCTTTMEIMGVKPEELMSLPNLGFMGLTELMDKCSKGEAVIIL